ncbi:glutathione S-transferase T3-like protein [Tanacetum coccineum]
MYRPQRASPPPSQSSPIPAFNLDDDNFKPLRASASQLFQPYSEGPSQPVEDDSPVEEVEPVKPKRKYTRRSKPTKKNDKEFVEPWTIKEEIALCKAWVAKSEDSVEGNGKKNGRVSQFCEIYNSVRDRHQSGSCDNTVYQEAEIEYRTIYNASFTLTECWNILKDHPKWKKVEMPKFYKSKKSSSKKSRTSENTSQGNLYSAHIGVNLNDEAADSEDVEAQEVPAPMGRDRAKKKGSSSGARSETSTAGVTNLVDALLSKFTMATTPFFTQRKESSSEYLRIKERELELEERKRQEQGELERLRIAQREKELELQQKMFKFQQQQKFEEDLKYYNEDHEHLTGRALSTALFLKKKIKERWNLDY